MRYRHGEQRGCVAIHAFSSLDCHTCSAVRNDGEMDREERQLQHFTEENTIQSD